MKPNFLPSLSVAAFLAGACVWKLDAEINPAKPAVYQATPVALTEDTALAIDAVAKEYTAKVGEDSCVFRFTVKNTSKAEVVVTQVRTSCGCTVAKLPDQPWKIAPGAGGDIELIVDLRGKSGILVKTATIDTPTTFKVLTLKVTLPGRDAPATMEQMRARNQQMAAVDRQAVFKGECAQCHVQPSLGQMGAALYLTACAICHDAEHRGSMVPDLRALNHPTDREFWRLLATQGKPGTLMPAFAAEHGGPLSAPQIDSLVDYLTTEFTQKAPAARAK